MKKTLIAAAVAAMAASPLASANDYVIDTEGAHAFIQFKINHLGYSWLLGRFNEFEGTFSYDESAPENARVNVVIDTASIDSNHQERDQHLRSDDFLDVANYPQSTFVSTGFTPDGNGGGVLAGDFTLRGVTHNIEFQVDQVGAGEDPWGMTRRGFEGSYTFKLADYGIDYDLGPEAEEIEIYLSIEGIQQ
ncbi:MAG: YceI family protein [Firmicutes bacterium]|nr:YceI family protein [Bacillota bacterium]